jgi:hypothetical protein
MEKWRNSSNARANQQTDPLLKVPAIMQRMAALLLAGCQWPWGRRAECEIDSLTGLSIMLTFNPLEYGKPSS